MKDGAITPPSGSGAAVAVDQKMIVIVVVTATVPARDDEQRGPHGLAASISSRADK